MALGGKSRRALQHPIKKKPRNEAGLKVGHMAGKVCVPAVSVIECFETDGGVKYRSDRLILF